MLPNVFFFWLHPHAVELEASTPSPQSHYSCTIETTSWFHWHTSTSAKNKQMSQLHYEVPSTRRPIWSTITPLGFGPGGHLEKFMEVPGGTPSLVTELSHLWYPKSPSKLHSSHTQNKERKPQTEPEPKPPKNHPPPSLQRKKSRAPGFKKRETFKTHIPIPIQNYIFAPLHQV